MRSGGSAGSSSHRGGRAPRSRPPAPVLARREALRAALAAERHGDDAEAERRYRAALAGRPSSGELRLDLALACLGTGKRREAYGLLRALAAPALAHRAPPFGGDDTLAWYADLCAEFGDVQGAARAYGAATAALARTEGFRPADRKALAHVSGGERALMESRRRDAERHWRRAIDLAPRLIGPRLAIAALRFDDGRVEDGWTMLREAKRLGPNGDRAGWNGLISAYDRGERPEEARTMLRQAERAIPAPDARAWCDLARTGLLVGDRAVARRSFDRARKAALPSDAVVWCLLAAGDSELGDLARTREAIARARPIARPQDVSLYGGLARAVGRLGRFDEAEGMFRAAMPFANEAQAQGLESGLAEIRSRRGAAGVGVH